MGEIIGGDSNWIPKCGGFTVKEVMVESKGDPLKKTGEALLVLVSFLAPLHSSRLVIETKSHDRPVDKDRIMKVVSRPHRTVVTGDAIEEERRTMLRKAFMEMLKEEFEQTSRRPQA